MKTRLRSIIKWAKKQEVVWLYGINLSPTIMHMMRGEQRITEVEKEIISKLRTDGVAVTSAGELFGDQAKFRELDFTVSQMLEARSEEIRNLKLKANGEPAIGSKTFNLEMLGSELRFDAGSIFARFALSDPLLNIADGYFRMSAKLRYYNVWQTFASEGAARESQLWHFDREDNYILKAFLYLDDVDEKTGPFTYAPGTQKNGRNSDIKPEFFLEGGVRRTTDEQMNAVFPESNWVRGTGKKGTLILADTGGYHKGGEARTKDRLMYTCMYTSPASESKNLISFPAGFDGQGLDRKRRTALCV